MIGGAIFPASGEMAPSVCPLEELYRPFVLFSRFTGGERTEVFAPAGARIPFSRVEPVFAGFQFSDHTFGWSR